MANNNAELKSNLALKEIGAANEYCEATKQNLADLSSEFIYCSEVEVTSSRSENEVQTQDSHNIQRMVRSDFAPAEPSKL
eukprot:768174-Hanusia_phi.AAC.4